MNSLLPIPFATLAADEQTLARAALAATQQSYAPYSKFHVGAALRLSDGAIITGVNVENASYGLTNCAERTAVFRATAEGVGDKIVACAIVARSEHGASSSITGPCGACRQVLLEASQRANTDMHILLVSSDLQHAVRTTIAALIPLGFGPRDLGVLSYSYGKDK